MLKFVMEVAIAVWTTSTLFMLFFWANAFITTLRNDGKVFLMPFDKFLYIHFCPIVHTVKCFKIIRRIAELKAQAVKRGV